MTNKKWLWTWLLVALASVGAHLYLTQHHFGLHLGLEMSSLACDVSEKLNCDATALSPYSEIFGIPLSVLGLSTHIAMSLFVGLQLLGLLRRPQAVLGTGLLLSGFILGMSVLMAGVSSFLIKAYCPICILSYLLSAIQMGVAWKTWKTSDESERTWESLSLIPTEHRWILVVLILIPLGGLFLTSAWTQSKGGGNLDVLVRQSIEDWKAAPLNQFDLKKGISLESLTGEPELTLVEFADFLCPHCKKASPSLKAFSEHNRRVRLIFKPFPLDARCNNALNREGDGLRCELAYAAICAEEIQRLGLKMVDAIFERQHLWSIANVDPNLKEIAGKLSLDWEQLQSCRKDPGTRQKVLDLAAEGAAAKVEGTPSIYANGRKLGGGQLIP
ncbi:MAG: vitamin K epoxide reductase family protein, partial [Bdellovibrio sp.]